MNIAVELRPARSWQNDDRALDAAMDEYETAIEDLKQELIRLENAPATWRTALRRILG
jgi:hypothetical protein